MGLSPAVLIAIWLLVIGYTVAYVGLNTIQGKPISFRKAIGVSA